jgi:hypothetical protein
VKAGTYFAAATAALIVLSYLPLQLGFDSPGGARALNTSAVIALAVQIATFAIARRSAAKNLIVGWGIGTAVRILALALYATLVVPAMALPRPAALVSLVTFMFASMLIEPLLLAYDR